MKNSITPALLLLLCFSSTAQHQFTNNGAMKIHTGASIAYFGHFVNNGTLTDSGQMVYFNGTSAQNIGGSSATTFHNLTIANSGAGVSLTGSTSLTVTNSITLVNGIITTGSNTLVLSNPSAANLVYINGFIFGKLRRYVESNTATYLFPVGDGTASSNRHRFACINNSLTGVTFLDATVATLVQTNPNYDGSLNATQAGTPITSSAGAATGQTTLWTLTPDATPSGGSYGVHLYAENTNLSAADDNKFCPLKRNGSSSFADFSTYDGTTVIPAAGAAGRVYNSGNGYAQRTGYTTFSQHVIGKSSLSALPVELLSFDARTDENVVDIAWTTASECNNNYFIVQRSHEGDLFNDLIQMPGAGNSTSTKSYAAVDCEPFEGISYYRLKQVDFDGKFTCSSLAKVNFQSNEVISICPNPTEGRIYLLFQGVTKHVCSIDISSVSGMNVYHADGYEQCIDISNNPEGLYIVDFNLNSKIITKKIVLKK